MTTQTTTSPTASIPNALFMTFIVSGFLMLGIIYLMGAMSQSTYSVENIVSPTELSSITDPCVKQNLINILTPDKIAKMVYSEISIQPIYRADVERITYACRIKHDVTIDPMAIEQLKALKSSN